VKITGGTGVLLIAGEAFAWRPWEAGEDGNGNGLRLVNAKGQWDVGDEAWGVLELVWPKPGMLLLFNLFRSIRDCMKSVMKWKLIGSRFINSWAGKRYETDKS
jgi:hypothetical protein